MTVIMRTKLSISIWESARNIQSKTTTLPFIVNLPAAGRYEFFIPIRDWNFVLKQTEEPREEKIEFNQTKEEKFFLFLVAIITKRTTRASRVSKSNNKWRQSGAIF